MSASRIPRLAFGAGALLLGLGVIATARTIPTGFGYDGAGPRLLPFIIGIGLVASSLLVVVGALLSPRTDEAADARADEDGAVNWRLVAAISAALLFEALAIERVGWIVAGAVAFAAGAWAFGERRLAPNLALGLLVCAAIQALFAFGLGIGLPLGPFAALLAQAG